jgi:hypothetical protein
MYVCEISIVSAAGKRSFQFYEAKFSIMYHVGIIRENVALLSNNVYYFMYEMIQAVSL